VNSGKSVGRRLFFLVAIEAAIGLLLVAVAVRTTDRIADDYRHMYDFQFTSVAAIGQAMAEAENLNDGFRSPELSEFYRRYRRDWETASGSSPDAIRFREDLSKAGALDLQRIESEALADLENALHSGNVRHLRQDLRVLYNVNLRYAALEDYAAMQRMRNGRFWTTFIGSSGIALMVFLGLHVRRAIAPRIRRLVGHVRKFQDTGKYERIVDAGKDDIAVLAHALDTGFSAIASRDRERDEFLSVAAHELKTPVTSIYGYSSVLVRNTTSGVDSDKALKAINRQSWRLSRLIDVLFLAMQARSGKLKFEPKPFDMSALVERVLSELEPFLPDRAFASYIQQGISILGDEALLEHALWALFTCAAAFSTQDVPLHIIFLPMNGHIRLTVTIKGGAVSRREIEELFMPFGFVEYETGSGIRSAVGLYLCREIVRLHNGSLRVEEAPGGRVELVLELTR